MIDFETGKEPKINMFDFGAFQDKNASRAKIRPSNAFWFNFKEPYSATLWWIKSQK